MPSNIYNLTDTWNAAGTTFAGIKINVTNTASAADSKLLDLQVGGTTRVAVPKDGYIQINPTVAPYYLVNVDGTRSIYTSSGTTINIGANAFDCVNGALKFGTDAGIGRASANLVEVNNGTLGTLAALRVATLQFATDAGIGRISANLVEVNNGTSGTLAALRVATLRRSLPVTVTANYTVTDNDSYIINNKAASSCTITLPAAASFPGREITIKTIQAFTVISASTNVVPRNSATAAAAILAATAGAWAKLVSDGTNWVIMQAA